MQLLFTNDFETPMLETKATRPNIVWPMLYPDHFKPGGIKAEGIHIQLDEDYETIDVDVSKTIRKVSILTEEKGGYLLRGDRFVVKAMKMYGDDGTVIFKE